MKNDTMIFFGGEIKALDENGRVGGYGIRFSDGNQRDVTGEWFTKSTYLGAHNGDGADVLFHHGIPVSIDLKAFADHIFSNAAKATVDDVGVFVETVLDQSDAYEKAVFKLAKAGKLGWSSGSTMRVVRKSAEGEIQRWPIIEWSLTHKPAEPLNRAIAIKSVDYFDEIFDDLKATWTAKYVNDLPDSAFAFIESGGTKDKDGLTVPRSLRHFPYKDADGAIDEAHTRNALARIPQSDLPDADKAKALKVIEAAAKKVGIKVSDSGKSFKAATGADIFNQNLREQQQNFWRLESALCESAKDIVNAAQSADITGATVDVPSLVQALVAQYAASVTAMLTQQINDYLANENDQPFYLKSTLLDAVISTGLREGLKFTERLDVVLAANERLADDVKSICEIRAMKAGAKVSKDRRDRLDQIIAMLQTLRLEVEPTDPTGMDDMPGKSLTPLNLVAEFEAIKMRRNLASR